MFKENIDNLKLFLKYNGIVTTNFKKGNELNQLLYKKELKNQAPEKNRAWTILLHASYACNLNCIYCENHILRKNYNNAVMTEDLAREVCRKLGPNAQEITWHGGESLLLPNDLLIALHDECQKQNLTCNVSLQTNGLLYNKEKAEFLKKLGIDVGFSFDGLENSITRGKKSTEAILRILKEFGPDGIGFITVYNSKNIHNLIDNYNYYKSLGVTGFQSSVVRENVVEGTNPYLIDNDDAVNQVLKYIKYWIYDTDKPIRDNYVIRWISKLVNGNNGSCEDGNCIGGWISIDPIGNIGTCGMSLKDTHWCNIKDINSYTDLLTNPNYIKTFYKQKQLVKNNCDARGCLFINKCYGGCMGLNYEVDNDYQKLNIRNCIYTQQLLEGIFELIKDLDLTDESKFNPMFIQLLKENNYYSLTEIRKIEEEYKING